uniref:Hexosyltransferase n=1 Tax=Panagrolaimus sp. PS1159 TaxID=55785 RepID=A0AC35FBZ0_9BILA
MAFRKEWIKNANSSVIYRFFVGFTSNESIRQSNFEESKTYNDIVVSSIFDSHITLVFKTYSIFTWQQNFCPSVKYILQSLDNTLISVPRLFYWIENKFDKEYEAADGKIIFCRTMEYLDINAKYRIKSNNRKGFEYCENGAYLISSKATKLMLTQTKNENLKNTVEDLMFTGLLAEEIGAKKINFPKHFTKSITNCGCDKNNIPLIIASKGIWNDNSTFMSDYSSVTEKFKNMSCSVNGNNLEFFKACVARTG